MAVVAERFAAAAGAIEPSRGADMPTTFLPSTDAGLLGWAANVATQILPDPGAFGIPAALASQFATANDDFAAQLAAANNPETRTPVQIARKNAARAALRSAARQVAKAVDAAGSDVTDAQKLGLGLTVRAKSTSTQPPDMAPGVMVKGVAGHRVKLRLFDRSNIDRRGKHPAALGAAIYTYVGDDQPGTADQWRYHANTTRTKVEITFPDTVADFSRVWIMAHWLSPRLVKGPGSNPISTNLGTGATVMAGG